MKIFDLSIEYNYTDGRKDPYSFSQGPLVLDRRLLANESMSVPIWIKHINFENGDIELENGQILHSGVPAVIEKSYLTINYCCVMKDDGVICNEDTLYLEVYCRDSEKGTREKINLPYRKGIEVTMNAYPYQVKILNIHNEDVEVEIKDDRYTSQHLVQLYNYAERNDEHPYATGAPNDPVDYHGPRITITLLRK